MRQFPLWLCILLVLPVSATPRQRAKPPGIVTADPQSNQPIEAPMETRSRKLNVEQVKYEADELKKLADAVPAPIELVTKNQSPRVAAGIVQKNYVGFDMGSENTESFAVR